MSRADLLSHAQPPPLSPRSVAAAKASRRAFDDFQYNAHVAGERARRDREERHVAARQYHPRTSEHGRHRQPQLWFGEGDVGSAVVGKPKGWSPPPRSDPPVMAATGYGGYEPPSSRTPSPDDDAPEDPPLQYDRRGLPRGATGIDAVEAAARAAQREADERRHATLATARRLQQARLKADLDAMCEEKRRRALTARAHDAAATFGTSALLGQDDSVTAMETRMKRLAVERTWAEQSASRPAPAPQPKMDAWLDRPLTPEAAQGARPDREAWDKAKAEHVTASPRPVDLGPVASGFSDRILAASALKRTAQEQYRHELDTIVAERTTARAYRSYL